MKYVAYGVLAVVVLVGLVGLIRAHMELEAKKTEERIEGLRLEAAQQNNARIEREEERKAQEAERLRLEAAARAEYDRQQEAQYQQQLAAQEIADVNKAVAEERRDREQAKSAPADALNSEDSFQQLKREPMVVWNRSR
jgi:hypothetical protein